MLLQNVSLPTATAMGSDPILTQLITHTPESTVIIICSGNKHVKIVLDMITSWNISNGHFHQNRCYRCRSGCRSGWPHILWGTHKFLRQARRDSDVHSLEKHSAIYLTHITETTSMFYHLNTSAQNSSQSLLKGLTAVASSGGVCFIFSVGTVWRSITEMLQRDADTRRRTRPFSRKTLALDVI